MRGAAPRIGEIMINKMRLILVMAVLAAVSLPLFGAGRGEVSGGGPSEVKLENGEESCPEGMRFFDHELLAGEAGCIPENPERVTYLLYPSYIYPFGVNPVGSWGLERDAENYPFIADWIKAGTVDHAMPPNLEVLLKLEPDLMLYDLNRVTEVVDQLPAIAPLVLYDSERSFTWQERHRFNGKVLGQSELAEKQIAVYEERAAQLRGALEADGGDSGGRTVSIVRLRGEGVINLLGPWFTSVSVVRDAGFDLPDAVDMTKDQMIANYGNMYSINVAEERIDIVDADVLVVLGSPGGLGAVGGEAQSTEGDAIVAEMMGDPLWRTLDVFQSGRVISKGDYWLQSNILTAHLVIDELAEIFGVRVETANPFL